MCAGQHGEHQAVGQCVDQDIQFRQSTPNSNVICVGLVYEPHGLFADYEIVAL